MERLGGKRAIVTGAGAGIGRAIALRLASEGARVALADVEEGATEKVTDEIEGKTLVRRADVTRAEEVEALVRSVVEEWGGLDVLVNNAGVGVAGTTPETSEEDWERVMSVNLKGTFLGMKYAIPAMRDSGGGSIINITSGVSIEGRPRWGAYSVSKFGLEGLTQILAAELEERGVRVNSVDPGSMRTEMRAAAYPDEDPTTLITPEENTDVFLYLASDESRNVTGERFKAQEFATP